MPQGLWQHTEFKRETKHGKCSEYWSYNLGVNRILPASAGEKEIENTGIITIKDTGFKNVTEMNLSGIIVQ